MSSRGKLEVRPVDYNSYAGRKVFLQELGFSSYLEYLQSPLWESIRKRALQLHGDSCRLCGRLATNIHHLGYGRAVLRGDNLKPLVPLCSACHQRVEFKPGGKKRTVVEAHGAYVRLWKVVNYRRKQAAKEARRGTTLGG